MTADLKQSANLAGKVLASGQLANTSATAVYTVLTGTAAKITSAVLANVSVSAVTVTVAVVPSGQSLDGTRTIVPSFSLAAGDSTSLSELVGAFLDAGAAVWITASAGTAINYLLTGAVSS